MPARCAAAAAGASDPLIAMQAKCPHLGKVPVFDADFYSDQAICDPLPLYSALRDLGPVVYLSAHGNFAVTHYDAVREVLRNHHVFTSGAGVAADDFGCEFVRVSTLVSDPPLHDEMRRVVSAPLLPGALADIRPTIAAAAEALVDGLLTRDRIDGMRDIARFLPETVVTELVGLPTDGRENMLEWAAAAFDILGVQNERGRKAVQTIQEMRVWMETRARPEFLKPGSWTNRIVQMVYDGLVEDWKAQGLLRDYINPSLDTTISATGQLLYQLGRNPDQWKLLEEHPEFIPNAVNEAVRLSGAVRCMSRTVASDCVLAGVELPKGARIMVLFGCANRDPRQFVDPDRFDVTRGGLAHVGFGHGIHMCVGMHLASLEMRELLTAMLERVERIEAGEPVVAPNNTIYKFESLPLRLVPREVRRVFPAGGEQRPSIAWRRVRIARRTEEATDVVVLELEAEDGAALPAFEAGAHLDVKVAPGIVRQYSLANAPGAGIYRIGVLREPGGRGGSLAIHGGFREGTIVEIGTPRNNFGLVDGASASLLFAGGIGITPMLSMAHELARRGEPFHLHYSVRARDRAGFLAEIETAGWAGQATVHCSSEGKRAQLEDILRGVAPDTHVYVCGPNAYMKDVIAAARNAGLPDAQIHFEYFAAEVDTSGEPFTVVLRRSGREFEIGPEETILSVLEANGIEIRKSCLSGVCGTCAARVLEGTPDHRDFVLTEAEKAGNEVLTVCCSRSISRRLVLDL